MISAMTLPANLNQLSADELRELVRQQAAAITHKDRELNWRQVKIDKLTHEVAYYKRHYFGVKAERLQGNRMNAGPAVYGNSCWRSMTCHWGCSR